MGQDSSSLKGERGAIGPQGIQGMTGPRGPEEPPGEINDSVTLIPVVKFDHIKDKCYQSHSCKPDEFKVVQLKCCSCKFMGLSVVCESSVAVKRH